MEPAVTKRLSIRFLVPLVAQDHIFASDENFSRFVGRKLAAIETTRWKSVARSSGQWSLLFLDPGGRGLVVIRGAASVIPKVCTTGTWKSELDTVHQLRNKARRPLRE